MKLPDFAEIVGADGCLTNAADKEPFLHEWRGRLQGKSACVVLPKTTQQVSEVIKLCAMNHLPVVPQGGNTSLVGASVSDDARSVCISLKRMNAIRRVDAADFIMIAEAGCVLQSVKDTVAEQGSLFAMTLASEGSASIGGLIATNAGGSLTLRYGNMREQVLGLEAVLPDGSIWNGLKALHKDNSGYDLKQLLIGSEGTLGIITAASLRLRPLPRRIETAMIAVENAEAALGVLAKLRIESGDRLAAFELMPQLAVSTVVQHLAQRAPFQKNYPWIALIETHDSHEKLSALLAGLLNDGLILDAVVAEIPTQQKAFWTFREMIVEGQKYLGASLKNDLSVSIAAIPALLAEGETLVLTLIPGIRPYLFGHVGDGNIHFNLSQPEGIEKTAFLAMRDKVEAALHDLVLRLGGSISAEHGIGRFKRREFHRVTEAAELEMMRKIKQALDPEGIMNPGVIF